MALNIAELLIVSLIISWLFRKIQVPSLVGMLFVGVLFGPYVLGLLEPSLLQVSSDLRMVALIVILLRAGFELKKDVLYKVGRMAMLLSFIPAIIEGLAITLLAPILFPISYLEAAILGSILAAVSPAVVVPLMIKFIEERRGTAKGIPSLVLAASSVDDVFVIVGYSVLMGIYTGSGVNPAWIIAGIPLGIGLGIIVGVLAGIVLYKIFDRCNPRATKRLLILLAVSTILVHLEQLLANVLPFASLLAVMSIGYVILDKREKMAHEISSKLAKLWIVAEIILFTMVGAEVDIHVAWKAGFAGFILILSGLIARSVGTWFCMLRSNLDWKEKVFVVVAYLPKATVQAAIGAGPLAAMRLMGAPQEAGEIILAIAVLSIIITAPAGAVAISILGKRFLSVEGSSRVSTTPLAE